MTRQVGAALLGIVAAIEEDHQVLPSVVVEVRYRGGKAHERIVQILAGWREFLGDVLKSRETGFDQQISVQDARPVVVVLEQIEVTVVLDVEKR